MGNLFSVLITEPLGAILGFIYSFVNSYGLTIILFTIVIKIILLPLAIKQQKSMAQQQKIQPLIAEIQKKYKNDKEKMNQEMMKLYQEHKFNPAGGCLPLLIQLPIIFGLYRVIYRPLTYILNITTDEQRKALLGALNTDVVLEHFTNKEIVIAEQMQKVNIEVLRNATGIADLQYIDFNFFHIVNLAQTPNFTQVSALWLIPILAAATTYISSYLTTKLSMSSAAQNEQAAQMQNSMMKMFPLMTGFICFTLPAGVGLYWIISNLVQMIQQVFLNKYFAPAKKEGK